MSFLQMTILLGKNLIFSMLRTLLCLTICFGKFGILAIFYDGRATNQRLSTKAERSLEMSFPQMTTSWAIFYLFHFSHFLGNPWQECWINGLIMNAQAGLIGVIVANIAIYTALSATLAILITTD